MLFGKKREEQEAIQIILDYVEGRITANEFKSKLEYSEGIKRLFLSHKYDKSFSAYKEYNYNLYDYFRNDYEFRKNNWDTVGIKSSLYMELCGWLNYYHIEYRQYTKYEDDYHLLMSFQPSWLDIADDQGIFDKLLAELPKDLSKTKQIAWGKERLKALFKYDKTYPRWIQSPEWPIVNGKPLVFSHQQKLAKDDIRVRFFFYDPDTKEEVVIEQFE